MENSSSINRLSEIWKSLRFILDLNQRKLGWLRFVHFHRFQHIFRWLQFSNRPQILSSIPTHSLTDQHPSLHIQFANNLLINIFSEDQFVQILKSHISSISKTTPNISIPWFQYFGFSAAWWCWSSFPTKGDWVNFAKINFDSVFKPSKGMN